MFKIFRDTKGSGGIKEALYEKMVLKGLEYPVAKHAQKLPYMLGGMTLAGFIILFATGAFMGQYYNSNQLSPHQSVAYTISQVPFGNFIRSVHFWTANAVFILIILHLIRVFISGSYKSPRKFIWYAGLGLFAVTTGFMFIGTILSLGYESFETMRHSSEVGVLIGSLGLWFTGGFSVSVPLIGRAYVPHISILVIGFILFIIAYFYLVHMHRVSPKADRDAIAGTTHPEGSQPFTDRFRKLAGWAFILYAIIALLALLSPEPLDASGVSGGMAPETKPPWMFMWLYGMEDVFGIKALVWGPVALFVALGLIPLIDRSPYLSPRRRPFIMVYGAVILIALAGFTIQAYSASPDMAGMREGMRPQNVPFAYLLPGKYGETRFPAPLQLPVVSAVNPQQDFNTDSAYPIPYSEIPWIIIFIGSSFGGGVILLRKE